jgi:hypothetical protein
VLAFRALTALLVVFIDQAQLASSLPALVPTAESRP